MQYTFEEASGWLQALITASRQSYSLLDEKLWHKDFTSVSPIAVSFILNRGCAKIVPRLLQHREFHLWG